MTVRPVTAKQPLEENQGDVICALHPMITTPGAFFGPLPNCSAIGQLAALLSLILTVCTPMNSTINSLSFAILKDLFHLPPVLGIGITLAKSTMAPVS